MFVSCCSTEKGLCQNCDMFEFRRRGNELPNLHVDAHAEVFADEDGLEVSLGRVYLEA